MTKIELIPQGAPEAKIDRQRALVTCVLDLLVENNHETDDWIALGLSVLTSAITHEKTDAKRQTMYSFLGAELRRGMQAADLADRMDRHGGSAR